MVVPCSNGGPQVCEIGDWKISLRPHVKIAQSPYSALRASWGDWLIFTLGLWEIFQSPISQSKLPDRTTRLKILRNPKEPNGALRNLNEPKNFKNPMKLQ